MKNSPLRSVKTTGALLVVQCMLTGSSFAVDAFINWNTTATGARSNGDGSGPGVDPVDYTYIGNGTGVNEWNNGLLDGTTTTIGPGVITNTFNSTALTGGFDVAISIDSTAVSMNYLDSFPEGGSNWLFDSPGVGRYLDATNNDGTNAANSDSLHLRIDSSTGTVPAGNDTIGGSLLGTFNGLENGGANGGTYTYADLTAETYVIKIDPLDGVIFNVDFNLYEIELLTGNGTTELNWDHESVVVTGYAEDGSIVLPTITRLDPTNSVAPIIEGNRAIGVGGQSGHHRDDAGINVSFGDITLDFIDIEYQTRRTTSVGAYSFGLGVGDIAFEIIPPIPEPSSAIMVVLGSMMLMARRRRST